MAIVTINTLASYGFIFKDALTSDVELIITNKERDYLDAALSPQLADVFISDPDAVRFQEIREGWIDDDNCRQKGLDYGINYWCAWWIVKELSYSVIDGYVGQPESDNKLRVDAPVVFGNEAYNEASNTAYNVTLKIEEDSDNFEEFTEGHCLGYKSFYQ